MIRDIDKSQGKRPEITEVVEDTESHNLKTLSKNKVQTDVPTEDDSVDNVSLIDAQFAELELQRMYRPHKSHVASTTLTKNWYSRPTPPDL